MGVEVSYRVAINPLNLFSLLRSRSTRDERGAALIYITLILPVFIGLGVPAIDGSRNFNLQTEPQKGDDTLALAAAAEMDGRPDAIARANAIAAMVRNEQRVASGARAIYAADRLAVGYLSTVPGNDATAIPNATPPVTTDSADARYVEVKALPRAWSAMLPAAFIGGAASGRSSATAGRRLPCSTSTTSDNPDRRSVYGAIINCTEVGVSGGSERPYPVPCVRQVLYYSADSDGTQPDAGTIFAKCVGVVSPG